MTFMNFQRISASNVGWQLVWTADFKPGRRLYSQKCCRKRERYSCWLLVFYPVYRMYIQKTEIVASSSITSCKIDGEKVETVTDFLSWTLKSLQTVTTTTKLKMLAPWEKSFDKPRQHIKKQRCLFTDKVPTYGFSNSHVQIWELDRKEPEHQRIDAFELWCWRRHLRVLWTARRSNQSILKEISPEYSMEGLMLKLKPQYFGHLVWRSDSLEKTLMLGKIEGRMRSGQ